MCEIIYMKNYRMVNFFVLGLQHKMFFPVLFFLVQEKVMEQVANLLQQKQVANLLQQKRAPFKNFEGNHKGLPLHAH
jgi:hypothetical protein